MIRDFCRNFKPSLLSSIKIKNAINWVLDRSTLRFAKISIPINFPLPHSFNSTALATKNSSNYHQQTIKPKPICYSIFL